MMDAPAILIEDPLDGMGTAGSAAPLDIMLEKQGRRV